MNLDHLTRDEKSDIAHAVAFAIRELKLRAPQGGLSSEPERGHMFTLGQLRDAAEREARA